MPTAFLPRPRRLLAAVLSFFVVASAFPVAGQDLNAIAREIDGKRLRTSSGLFDPESNIDSIPIPPGQTITLADLEGPGEIRHLWFTIGALDRRFTRSLVLRIYWDDAPDPSVESPIGDFFAAGNGMRAVVSSLPIEVTSYGRAFNSYWRMPFRRHARLTMTNDSDKPVEACYFYIDWLRLPAAPDRMVYFHARYRQEFPVKPFTPYTVTDIRGKGQYVGTVLSIQSSMGSWLGESDDRFYIDGEAEPSLVGTGLEDYFTDAWNLRLFSDLRAGVTIYEPKGEDQRATMYRWHIADPITFRSSLKVQIERRSYAALVNPSTGEEMTWDFKYRPDRFSSVAFWYATEPAPRFWSFPPLNERVDPEVFVETTQIWKQLAVSPGVQVVQRYTRSTNAAGGEARKLMTVIENDHVGGWVDVPVDIPKDGDYSLSIYQMLFEDFGIWKVTLNGPSGSRLLHPDMDFFDRFSTERRNMPENYLYGTFFENKVGVYSLVAGHYVVRFECVGTNPLSRQSGVAFTPGGARSLHPEVAGRPGYDMALDGLSFRRLPWRDNWAWMQDYLKREARLFAERVATARRVVNQLSAAVERFRADTGAYPERLTDLLKRPARFAGTAGTWPYLQDGAIPRDPWAQEYRYRVPGRHNPGSFDLYSVRGNERRPEGWIGNWPSTPGR